MKPMTQTILIIFLLFRPTVQATTVFDPINLVQNILSAVSEMTQQVKQVQQYSTQLQELATATQQLQNMVQNTQTLTHFTWDDAQGTIAQLLALTDTISQYKKLMGDVNQFLNTFQNIDFYRQLPCIGSNTCNAQDLTQLNERDRLSAEANKKATDALILGIDQQQQSLVQDTAQLRRLQQTAQSSTGRLQALQAANQLASEQSHQLLQIRGLLLAQSNALATQMAVQHDHEARALVLEETFKSGAYQLSKGKTW